MDTDTAHAVNLGLDLASTFLVFNQFYPKTRKKCLEDKKNIHKRDKTGVISMGFWYNTISGFVSIIGTHNERYILWQFLTRSCSNY